MDGRTDGRTHTLTTDNRPWHKLTASGAKNAGETYEQHLVRGGLTVSLLMTTHKALVDSVDQNQTTQNVQSELWSTLSTFFILDYNWTVSSACNGNVFLANEKVWFIQSKVKDLMYLCHAIYQVRHLNFCLTANLTLFQTSPGIYVSAVRVFWKHCGKRRNCS